MSEAALEEVSVLSSIYCGDGEFELLHQSADGVTVQITSSVLGGGGVTLLFHLPPSYPLCPPDVSVSSTALSRTQCQSIRRHLLHQAASLPPEAMVHQLMESLQTGSILLRQDNPSELDLWVSVLSLDHIRSRNRYVSLLERWSKQLQLSGRLILGRNILVLLQGNKANIKEFCCLLKTVKVDVDSSGRKCKEKLMKVLIETPVFCSGSSLQGFVVGECSSLSQLRAAFEEVHLGEVYRDIQPSLRD
uniref:RWD domain-containing protein 3 n=1 Tax=Periophthalmus magnuspinnatus TaxID=409849 RepID=A0A3B3ZFD0_9GOBI